MPLSDAPLSNVPLSKSIAGLVGPLLLAIGIAILFNREMFPAMVAQLGQDIALIFLSGAILLVCGVAIVRVHNIWSGGWPVLVTALGWIAAAGGVVRMLFPRELAAIAVTVSANPTTVILAAAVLAAVGAFLSAKSYL
jgi:hypothetical protein